MKIYLAGKISKNGWRNQLVDLKDSWTYGYNSPLEMPMWPILQGAILGHDYTGPYFVACDHGCFHQPSNHGWADTGYCGDTLRSRMAKEGVLWRCKRAIIDSDMVFAWIESKDAYGTFAEIGYAVACNKLVYIAGPEQFTDLWFIYTLAQHVTFNTTPRQALEEAISDCTLLEKGKMLESPIERKFWDVASIVIEGIEPQLEIGPYRVDFAIPTRKIVIELDGHDFHKTKEQRTHDAKRERYLQVNGWTVIRFTGTEIHNDVAKCVQEVINITRSSEES